MVLLLSRAGFEAEELTDYRGLNQRAPWYAFLMLLLMFSLAGMPPTVGFYAKLAVLDAVVKAGQLWLAVFAVRDVAHRGVLLPARREAHVLRRAR